VTGPTPGELGEAAVLEGGGWVFDNTAGIAQGRRVANFVLNNAFQRRTDTGPVSPEHAGNQ
jgi:hypothetical protein